VFEPADKAFDFSGSDFAPGEVKRHGSAQSGLGSREPIRRGVPVAFEKLQRPGEQPRGTEQSVRLIRKESSFTLAARHRPTRNVDQVSDSLKRQGRVSAESLERAVRQTLLHRTKKVEWTKDLEAKQDHVSVWSWRAESEVLPESIEVLRPRVRASMTDGLGCRHVSHLVAM